MVLLFYHQRRGGEWTDATEKPSFTRTYNIVGKLRRHYSEAYPATGGLSFGIVPLLEKVDHEAL